MANNIKVGDVVELKSGGPDMTVSRILNDGTAQCLWIADGEPKSIIVHPDILSLAKSS